LKKAIPWWLVFAAVMCLLPLFVSSGTIRIFIFANFLAIFAMSWDILSGYTGYISAEVSMQVHRRPDYDPLAAATMTYETIDGAFRKAGLPRE